MTTEYKREAITQKDRDAAEALDDALGFLTDRERPIVEQAFARHRLASVSSASVEKDVWGKWHKMTLALVNAIHRDHGVKTQAIGIEQSYTQALAALALATQPESAR